MLAIPSALQLKFDEQLQIRAVDRPAWTLAKVASLLSGLLPEVSIFPQAGKEPVPVPQKIAG